MTTSVRGPRQLHVSHVDETTGFWVQDCRMTILASSADTAGQVGVVHVTAPVGHEPPLHVHHDEDEAYFVITGHMSVQCGDQRTEAGPGTWVFLPHGAAHSIRVSGDEPVRFLMLLLPGGFEAFFGDQASPATAPGLPAAPEPPDLGLIGRIFARHHVEPVGPPPA